MKESDFKTYLKQETLIISSSLSLVREDATKPLKLSCKNEEKIRMIYRCVVSS